MRGCFLADRDASGMIDARSVQTGQEFTVARPGGRSNADRYGWENRIRLKGIDVTVYAYALVRTLEALTQRVGAKPNESNRWRVAKDRITHAVRERMWDPDAQIFCDVDPKTGARTGVLPLSAFARTQRARDERTSAA